MADRKTAEEVGRERARRERSERRFAEGPAVHILEGRTDDGHPITACGRSLAIRAANYVGRAQPERAAKVTCRACRAKYPAWYADTSPARAVARLGSEALANGARYTKETGVPYTAQKEIRDAFEAGSRWQASLPLDLGASEIACAVADEWSRENPGPKVQAFISVELRDALDTLELATRPSALRKVRP